MKDMRFLVFMEEELHWTYICNIEAETNDLQIRRVNFFLKKSKIH
jgi:hypothetical protein